jgi:F-type H+-transporting ATPase subunit delta
MAKAHDVTRQTVRVMAENRRLWLLPRVAEAFGHLLAAEKGEIEVEVTSAAPLSPKQKEALETTFKKAFSSKVLLKEQVNAKILGGLQVKVGSEMIDASVEGSLDRLSRLQKAANLKG